MAPWFRVLLVGVAVCLPAVPAGAQVRQEAAGKRVAAAAQAPELRAGDGESYEVKFDDELLDGVALDGTLARIHVRVEAARSTLIRPRTHFVPELLKSVERL
jgi:hypothetical protein